MVRLCLLILAVAAPALGEDWSRFRGPNGTGVASGSGYPVEFGEDHNQLWRSSVRMGKSSPVLSEDGIFLTAAEDGRLYTQCFDRKTGKLLWEHSVKQPRSEIANRLNHEASITPVTDGTNVYSFFKDFGLVAYNGAGEEIWQSPLGPFKNLMGVSTSPILAGGDVIMVVDQWEDSFIAAFDPQSGEMKWKTPRAERDSWSTPVLHNGRIATAARGIFGLHDASDGNRIASFTPVAITIIGTPVVVDDIFYVFGYGNSGERSLDFAATLERNDKNGDGKLTPDEYGDRPIENQFAKNSGNRDGVLTADEWEIFRKSTYGINALSALRLSDAGVEEVWRNEGNYNNVVPSLLAHDGVLYLVRNGGILTTYDAGSGEELRKARLTGAPGGYSASPVTADDRIWFASEEGYVAVIKAGRDWTVEQVNELGESIYATPALSEGAIYLRTEDALYAFSE